MISPSFKEVLKLMIKYLFLNEFTSKMSHDFFIVIYHFSSVNIYFVPFTFQSA